MSENINIPEMLNPITLIRNGTSKVFTVLEGKKKGSKWEGVKYQAPQFTTDGTDSDPASDQQFLDAVRWLGKDNVINSQNAIVRRFGQDFIIDAIDEISNLFSLDTYKNFWINLTSSALTKAELEEALDQVNNEFNAWAVEVAANAAKFGSDETYKQLMTDKSASLQARSASIRKTLEARKARKSKETESETVMAQ